MQEKEAEKLQANVREAEQARADAADEAAAKGVRQPPPQKTEQNVFIDSKIDVVYPITADNPLKYGLRLFSLYVRFFMFVVLFCKERWQSAREMCRALLNHLTPVSTRDLMVVHSIVQPRLRPCAVRA